jgi:hypothetical protein
MSLPSEAIVTREIANKYARHLAAMSNLHDTVTSMMTAGSWTVSRTRGLTPNVARTMMGLLTKALKTFRSIQILCERGLHEDANALVRVLMETTAAILFILQKRSRERTLIYHAYGISQGIRMLNDWKQTAGLKRGARIRIVKALTATLADAQKNLPGIEVTRHWSGKPNLYEAMKTLRGGRVMYAMVFRHTSSFTHGSDFGAHVTPADDDDVVYEIEPRVEGFDGPTYTARQLLWLAASRIDERFGLGFEKRLARQKLTRQQIEQRLQ